jgi:hypothetical protein
MRSPNPGSNPKLGLAHYYLQLCIGEKWIICKSLHLTTLVLSKSYDTLGIMRF